MGQSIRVSTAAPVIILPFHKDVLASCKTGLSSQQTLRAKLAALLTSRYGAAIVGKDAQGKETRSGGPTYDQYRADMRALRQLTDDARAVKGADVGQYVRKSFARAVADLYGALPEAQTAAALAMRAKRDAERAVKQAAQTPGAGGPGAPKGETQDHGQTESEAIESVITRIGLFRTLDACVALLAADAKTKAQAAHIAKMVAKAHELAV